MSDNIVVDNTANTVVVSDTEITVTDVAVVDLVTTSADGLMSKEDKVKLDAVQANATDDQTAAEILTAIKTVDGASSGLDADLLDGQEGSYYTGYADTVVNNLIDSAPDALNTLNELAAALGDDANFSATVTNSLAAKLPLSGGQMTGNITMSGSQTVDGRDISVDGAKLDGIEVGATADQTAAQIKTAYESNSDTNAFTDADHSKLDGIEAGATTDQTATEIRALVESASNSNVFTDADHSKLDGIEASATADQTDAEIRAAVEAATDSNVFTDADHSKLNAIEANATADQTASEIEAIVSHDNLQGFVANEHIDWSADQGSTNIHSGNYINTTYSVGDGGLTQNNFTDTLKAKLDGVEAGATADQTASEIKTAYESNADTNAFTDADHSKLDGIEANATADQTDAQIRAAVAAATDSNVFTDADHTKLDGIEANATADQTASEIEAIVNHDNLQGFVSNEHIDWTADQGSTNIHSGNYINTTYSVGDGGLTQKNFTTTLKTKLDGIEAGATADQTDAEIRAAVEAATDSNVFTDADHSKLNAIEASADVTDTANVVAALTAGTNVSIASDGTISATDTNTTYTSSDFNHDDLTGFVANEHIDWTASSAGSIHITNLPATALTTVQTASSQSAMLALTTQEGDVVVRSDENKTYMHNGGSAGTMADFTLLATPTDAVTSVDGATGAITLNHDTLTGFVANEHIDWTTDQGATNLHAGNYTNTTYSVEDGGLTQNNFTNTLKTKLDGIETAATADQTAAEIRALVESATDSNIFTDADHTKLNAIEASATADQTASEIEAVVNHDNLQGFVANEHIDWTASGAGTIHSSNYTDTTYTAATTSAAGLMSAADKAKLNGVETGATADQSAAEIKTAYESNSDTNAFTDADHSKLDGIASSANNYSHPNHSGEVTSTGDGATVIADGVVDEANLKVSNAPTDGYVLTAQSGNTGGLTWAAASGGSALTVKDEGTALSTDASSLNFVGAAVTASGTGADKTITISSDAANLTGTLPASVGAVLDSELTSEASVKAINQGLATSDSPTFSTVNATNVVASNLMQANSISLTGSLGVMVNENIIFEGTTADNYETFFTATDPTADRTITLPDATGTVALTSDINATNVTAAGALMDSEVTNLSQVKAFDSSDYATAAQGSTADAAMPKSGGVFTGNISFEGATANDYETTVTVTDPTADRTITLPDATGTVLLADGDGSNLTNVQAASVSVTESSDDNVTYNVLFSDTSGTGNVQMTPTQDDNGLTFNPHANELWASKASHQHVYVQDYIYHTGDTDTNIRFETDSIKLATGGTERLHLNSSGVQINNAYTLPTADGSANYVLTTNGSGVVSWAEAASGADLYAANESSPSAQPSATGGNAVAIGEAPTASGNDSFAVQGGTASGNGALAIGRNVGGGNVSLSRANSTVAIMGSTTTNNHYSTAIGLNSSAHLATVGGSGMGAMALGGSYASGADSLAAAIANNTSSYGALGANSIAMGYQAKATGSDAISVGRLSQSTGTRSVALGMSSASGQDSFAAAIDSSSSSYGALANNSIAMGRECKAEGVLGVAIGDRSIASAVSSVAIGTTAQTRAKGHIAFGSGADTGYSSTDSGRAQSGIIVLRGTSGDAVQKTIVSDGALETVAATDDDNQLIVPSYGAIAFDGLIVAREKASTGTDCAAWKVEGLIRRENAANTTTLVNSAITVINNAPSWDLALAADTTYGALNVKVTGAASTNVRWVCTLRSSETWYS